MSVYDMDYMREVELTEDLIAKKPVCLGPRGNR